MTALDLLAAQGNRFLASLPEDELRTLAPKLERIRLPQGEVLCDANDEDLSHAYFPVSGILSLAQVSDSGASSPLAMVGREGMVGAIALLGGPAVRFRAIVQAPGMAARLPMADARAQFAAGGRFRLLVLNRIRAFVQELAQTAFCNQHHSIEQQLSRWLLLSLDRLPRNEIQMTHEMAAGILGVRRQSVTEAAGRLERRKAIAHFRGRIVVLDRPALEEAACECYAAILHAAPPAGCAAKGGGTSARAASSRAP